MGGTREKGIRSRKGRDLVHTGPLRSPERQDFFFFKEIKRA